MLPLVLPAGPLHDQNKDDPASAVTEALIWWQQQTQAPSNEDRNLRENAPLIRSLLSEKNISQMTQERLTELLMATHASKEHMGKVAGSLLGLPANRSASKEERGERYAAFLWNQRNERGESVPQVLHYVLYGGHWQEVPNRLFDAVFDDSRKIQHLGVNQIAEMVGWALPEHYPPRNGRTSKGLKALGYPVEVRA